MKKQTHSASTSLLVDVLQVYYLYQVRHKTTGKVIEVIKRTPFHKGFAGNFVPVYIRYKDQVYFLHGGWDYAYIHGKPSEAWIEV